MITLRRYLCRKCQEEFQYASTFSLDGHINSRNGFACGPVDELTGLVKPEEVIATIERFGGETQVVSWGKW